MRLDITSDLTKSGGVELRGVVIAATLGPSTEGIDGGGETVARF